MPYNPAYDDWDYNEGEAAVWVSNTQDEADYEKKLLDDLVKKKRKFESQRFISRPNIPIPPVKMIRRPVVQKVKYPRLAPARNILKSRFCFGR